MILVKSFCVVFLQEGWILTFIRHSIQTLRRQPLFFLCKVVEGKYDCEWGYEWMNVALLLSWADYLSERVINENPIAQWLLSQVLLSGKIKISFFPDIWTCVPTNMGSSLYHCVTRPTESVLEAFTFTYHGFSYWFIPSNLFISFLARNNNWSHTYGSKFIIIVYTT